jgi:hypothetical protein
LLALLALSLVAAGADDRTANSAPKDTAPQPTTAPTTQPTRDLQSELRNRLGPSAALHPTRHFLIAADAPDAPLTELGDQFERLHAGYLELLQSLRYPPRPLTDPLVVLYYTDPARYAAQRDRVDLAATAIGFYDAADNRVHLLSAAAYLTTAATAPSAPPDLDTPTVRRLLTATAIQHEGTHLLQHNLGPFAGDGVRPPWLIEGFAWAIQWWRPEQDEPITAPLLSPRPEKLALADRDPLTKDALRRLVVADDAAYDFTRDNHRALALVRHLYQHHRAQLAIYLRRLAAADALSDDQAWALFLRHFGPLDDAWLAQLNRPLTRPADHE